MPKKNTKAKDKKVKRKEQLAAVSASASVVQHANKIEDHMAGLPSFQKFIRPGVSASIECVRSAALSPQDMEWVFRLTKDNMKAMYINSGWAWKDGVKRDEMFDERMWFIVARSTTDQEKLGFVSFRFDIDDNVEVLYVYEIQLELMQRRRGLGKFLMQLAQLIAARAQMQKIVATVLKENGASLRFFQYALGYEFDSTSPCVSDPTNARGEKHEILCRRLRGPMMAAIRTGGRPEAEGEASPATNGGAAAATNAVATATLAGSGPAKPESGSGNGRASAEAPGSAAAAAAAGADSATSRTDDASAASSECTAAAVCTPSTDGAAAAADPTTASTNVTPAEGSGSAAAAVETTPSSST